MQEVPIYNPRLLQWPSPVLLWWGGRIEKKQAPTPSTRRIIAEIILALKKNRALCLQRLIGFRFRLDALLNIVTSVVTSNFAEQVLIVAFQSVHKYSRNLKTATIQLQQNIWGGGGKEVEEHNNMEWLHFSFVPCTNVLGLKYTTTCICKVLKYI